MHHLKMWELYWIPREWKMFGGVLRTFVEFPSRVIARTDVLLFVFLYYVRKVALKWY